MLHRLVLTDGYASSRGEQRDFLRDGVLFHSQPGSANMDEERRERQQDQLLEPPRFTVLGDQPIHTAGSSADHFDLAGRIGPIYDILRHPDTATPMAMAIYGEWGSGKTSAMKWLDEQLGAWRQHGKADPKITVRTAWFFPWKYHSKEDVWRGLVAEIIIACLKAEGSSATAFKTAVRDLGKFLGKSFVSLIASSKLTVGISETAKVDIAAETLTKEVEQHLENFVNPQNAYLNDFEDTLEHWIKETLGKHERMVVFIDDLDRCMPEVALQVLEALKLYLNIENLIFLVGVDRDVVDSLVTGHYEQLGLGPEKSRSYLAKMFTVEVTLAPSDPQIDQFLDLLVDQNASWQDLSDLERTVFRGVIRRIASRSPREMKRLINSALMAGAGTRMSTLANDNATESPTAAQGIQVFLIRRILHDRHTQASLVEQDRGTGFFTAWSNILHEDDTIERTLSVPASYMEQIQKLSDQFEKQDPAEQTLGEILAEFPEAYHAILIEKSFHDLLELLDDRDLGELMRIPYPAEAATISNVFGGGGAAQIVRDAIARELGKSAEQLVADDYNNITELDLSGQEISDLAPLAGLTALETLNLYDTQISELTPLAGLTALQALNLNITQISDLTPLANLTALTTLILDGTLISDLTPLAGLSTLQRLALNHTLISDLAPLTGLTALEKLHLENMQISDLAPLAGLTALKSLILDRTLVRDLTALARLTALETLYLDNTRVSDLAPLAGLTALESLHLDNTQISDLAPLAGLTALETLIINRTLISDLTPLAGLTALETLYLDNTRVSDLAPLAGLTALKTIYLNGTRISDLTPLAGLTALETLYLDNTRVSDLAPLAGLTALKTIYLNGTRISDLAPLAGLSALKTIYLNGTRISDLSPLSRLTKLQELELNDTLVSDLAPLASLTELRKLHLRDAQIAPAQIDHFRELMRKTLLIFN